MINKTYTLLALKFCHLKLLVTGGKNLNESMNASINQSNSYMNIYAQVMVSNASKFNVLCLILIIQVNII